MAGMFSWLTGDDTSSLGGMPDRMAAAGTPMRTGVLGNTFRDDPGAIQPNGTESMFGPLTGAQKTSLLFAGLRDMANSFSGGTPSNYLGQQGDQFYRQNTRGAQKAANEKIRAAYATGDMNKVRAAVMDAAASGADISHITDAVKAGQPEIKTVGDSLVSVDPLSGTVSPLYKGRSRPKEGYDWNPAGTGQTFIPGGPADPANRPAPNGYQWNTSHTKVEPIPGYIEGAAAIAGARRKPTSAGPNSPIALPHPGSLY